MRLFPVLLILAALAFPAGSGLVAAQNVPEAVWLDMPHVMKENADWCWLGVAEMAVRYRNNGQSPRQCQMLEMVFGYGDGSCCHSPGACGRGGTLEETGTVVLALSGGTASYTGPLEPEALYGVLQRGAVVIARRVPQRSGFVIIGPPPMGHVVVLRAMCIGSVVRTTPSGPVEALEPWILVNDPDFPEPIDVPYGVFRPLWTETLIIE